jgi:uncharacterized membrane protein YjfL (UPF0719 family)
MALQFLADPEVRSDPIYTLAYFVGGLLWLRFCLLLVQFLGIDWITDVVQKNNHAAMWAWSGAALGFTFCYAGANVGSGPGPEVVFFCAALASGSMLLAWFLLESLCGFAISESITIEREDALGIRLAIFVVSVGLIAGFATAGDWQSLSATVWDFTRFGWPIALVLLCAAGYENWARRRPGFSKLWRVLIPSATYLLIAAAASWRAGLR